MKRDLILLHYPDNNPKNWWVFDEKDCPDYCWFPSFFFRRYEIPSGEFHRIFGILMEIRGRLVELSILPSHESKKLIFPTEEELLAWNEKIKKDVLDRIELIIK